MFSRLLFLIGLAALPGSLDGQTVAPGFDIEPMTQVNVAQHIGYFGDPYPIHLAPWFTPALPQYFSGTTPDLLQCDRPIKPACFSATPLTLTESDALKSTVAAAGNEFGDVINHNVYQTLSGRWEMAVTLYVHPKGSNETKWTVIAHAHPADDFSLTPPASWVADKVLVGSLATFAYANYDGKYFEDEGKLYLIYSRRLITKPVEHDGIVAQELTSPAVLASSGPVTLLAPSNKNGGFTSEYFHTKPPAGDTFKLIETGNIIKIAGKYVMAYSAGDYQQLDYKTGVAFSDTLLPQPGQTYRKILEEDTAGVWGQPDHLEVGYLLQSQKAGWPNYVASQVIGPGVPSIVREPSGQYLLYFDGFLPGDTPPAQDKNPLDYLPDHRRPFFLPLEVAVPSSGSVSAATDRDLASWIEPVAN